MIKSTARLVRMAAIDWLADELERHGATIDELRPERDALGRRKWIVGVVLYDADGYTPHRRSAPTAGAALELALGDLALHQLRRPRNGAVRRLVDLLEE